MNAITAFASLLPAIPADIKLASREGILAMEAALCTIAEPGENQELFPLKHRFADNVYAREILLPAGTVVVGKIHRYGHLNVISQGHVSVLTENGVEQLHGPCTFISKPGTKRVVYAHEDTVWTTFHGTRHTNVDAVEADIICKTYAEFDALLQLENKP
jgi:hypothetical protein